MESEYIIHLIHTLISIHLKNDEILKIIKEIL